MLRPTILELFLRLIPEGFVFFLAVYTFSFAFINKKRYVLSSVLVGLLTYIIRSLPINYGVHTILILGAGIVLNIIVNKIDTIKSISACIITMILQMISESMNVLMIQVMLKKDVGAIFSNPTSKIVYGLPSLILTASISGIIYVLLRRKKVLKHV